MWDCPFRPARSPAETSQVVKNPIKPPLIPRRRLSFGKDPNLPAQDPPGTCFCSQKLLKGDIIPVSEEKQVSSISSWNEHNHTLTTWESSELHVLHRQLLYASCLLSKSRIHNYHKEHDVCSEEKCRMRCTLNSYHTQLASSQKIVYSFPLTANSPWVNQQLQPGLLEQHLKDLLFQSR